MQRFWQLSSEAKTQKLRMFFAFVISFLVLIFLSKDLLISLLFYSCLILASQLFAVKFLRHTEVAFMRLFTFLLYFQSFFFFLALVATSKFVGRIDFMKDGIITENLSSNTGIILLISYLFGLFFSVFLPYFILFRKPNIEPIITYIFFFLAYSFASTCILVKLLISIFGFDFLAQILLGNTFTLIELIFLFNIGVTSLFVLFSQGIKLSFFYLFFQQFFFVIFSIIFFATFKGRMIYLSLLSFSLSFTLMFFCVSSLTLYLAKTGQKSIAGLFHKLPINTSLLIFAILSMAGLLPTIAVVEKFYLLKLIWQKNLWISGGIIALNFVTLLIFAGKLFYYFFAQSSAAEDEKNLVIAKDIDLDSNLMLTALVTALLMFAGLFVTKFI